MESQIQKLARYKKAFRKCVECGAKQMGLRGIKEAEWLMGRNPQRVDEILGGLWIHLGTAQARTEEAQMARLTIEI